MQEPLNANRAEPLQPRLYTVAQFRDRFAALERSELILIGTLTVEMIAFGAIFAVVVHFTGPQPECPPMVVVGVFVYGLTVIGSVFGLLIGMDRRNRRDLALCPHCGKELDVASEHHFAIAIHCCPHCHDPLFQDWRSRSVMVVHSDDKHSAEGDTTFAAIGEAKKKRTRAIGNWLAVVIAVAAGVFGFTLAVLWIKADLLTIWFGELALEAAAFISLFPAAAFLGIGVFWAIWRTPGPFPKCAGCGDRLVDAGRWTQATGNCTRCGRRVIRDAPLFCFEDDPPKFPLIEHAQLAAWSARYQWVMVASTFFVFGLGGIAWASIFSWWYGISAKQPISIAFLPILFSGVFSLIFVLVGLEKVLKQRRSCPYCKGSLLKLTSLIHATGNCCHCGQRVLKPPASLTP